MADRVGSLIQGMFVGAGLAVLFDPVSGRRRRARLIDRLNHWLHRSEAVAGLLGRDAWNRVRGMAAETAASLSHEIPSDRVLEERVRAQMGRVVCRPHDVRVEARKGRVILSGELTAGEADDLIALTSRIRGVEEVESRLDIRPPDDTVAASPAAGHRLPMQLRGPSPGRIALGALGAAGLVHCLRRGGVRGWLSGLAGFGAAVAAVSRVPAKRVFGADVSRGEIEVRKAIHIAAPPDVVFDFWSRYENFPLFMSHLERVEQLAPGLTRWTVAGPGGSSLQWTAVTTDFIPLHRIGWETEDGSQIPNRGSVSFFEDPVGTRLEVRMTYRPPAGVVGHAVASVLGFDPKSRMDDDLNRMKTFIETGRLPGDARQKPEDRPAEAFGDIPTIPTGV